MGLVSAAGARGLAALAGCTLSLNAHVQPWVERLVAEADALRVQVRRDEAMLVNQAIPAELIGGKLRVWERTGWREQNQAEPNRFKAKVLVVNLWATYCKPCVTEFPVLREIARKIEGDYKEVQFVFLGETSDPEEMQAFYSKYEKILPRLPLFVDDNENIASLLRGVQPGGNLALPLTLVLDEQRNIRSALIGSVLERRSELVNSIEDAVRISRMRGPR